MLWIILIYGLCDFTLQYTSATEATECDEAFVGRIGNGVIKSYNFPFDYRHNLTCTYRIHLPTHSHDVAGNSQVCFTFYRFDLESTTPFCSYDYLKFHTNDNKEFDYKYCGFGWWQYGHSEQEPMATVWSDQFCWEVKSDYFDVIFNSDNNENRRGFYATYQVYTNGQTHPVSATDLLGDDNIAPCDASEWTCFNRRCVARAAVCDGVDTCGDGSDESYVHARCGEENVMACDFFSQGGSDGYCGFTHEGWFRATNSPSPYGPKGDHTNTTHGYYVYTDVYETSAYLLSPEMTLPRNRPYCLTFWYYMYGSPPSAKLSVYVSRDQAYSRPEWSRELNMDTGWQQAQVSFSTQSQLQVIFAAELDNKFSGIALDDITIFEGRCLGDDIACNFESGLCAWQAVNEIHHSDGTLRGDIQWSLNGPSFGATEPAFDRSSADGGGYYIYMNHSNGDTTSNSRALLYSPAVSQFSDSRQCLRFSYYMVGADKNCCLLTVKLHGVNGGLSADMWSKYGDIRSTWNEASVQLDIGSPFQIVLEGVLLPGNQGRIAIDKIYLENGECGDAGNPGECESGQYLCAHGKCIDGADKCNGQLDCEDGSDEDWHASCPIPTTTTVTTTTSSGVGPCTPDKHYCAHTGDCISSEWVCDGVVDCPVDQSDERHCTDTTPMTCADGSFRCADGTCISTHLVCDGHAHCSDQSDESTSAGCSATSTVLPCARGEFRCDSSYTCIDESLTCNDVKDCDDGSDEDAHLAKCAAAVTDDGLLGTGPAVGIAFAVIFLAILAILVILFVLRRRRQKRTPPPSRAETVSTIAYNDSMSRQMLSHPPPYGDQTNAMFNGVEGSNTETDEAPPPYDAVLKDQRNNQSMTENDNNQNNMLQQSWQATAMPQLAQNSAADRRSTRSMPAGSRRRAGSLPHARNVNAAHESVYVPRQYVPDPTENPPFQRSQSMFPERTRPLPRPPGTYSIYPPRGSGHSRIKLGTTALTQQPRGPRNYMNQGIHSEYDSDSTITTDHIYETLNLPSDSDNQSRCGSLHAVNHNGVSPHSNSGVTRNNCENHMRNASCSSDVFDPDSGINSSVSSYPSSHPYGPGFRPNSLSPYNANATSPINSTHARILYPNNAANRLPNQSRDKHILYRPGSNRRNSNPPYGPASHNVDRYKQSKMQSPNYMGSANALPMQYMGGHAPNVHHTSTPIQTTPIQKTPLLHNSTHNKQCIPHANPIQNSSINSYNPSQSPISNSAVNKHSFKPVPENEQSNEQSPRWQSPQHERNDSVLSARDLPTPDSQSNLIPSSNNSSFDQTQPSVVFLTDAEALLMNPTSV